MDDEERPTVRPSLGAVLGNWHNSDLPFFSRMETALRNNWTKMRTMQNCCGNLGEPGC